MSVIKLEKNGPIATLTLTRPEMMNALGQEGDGAAVAEACAEIEADPAIRVAPGPPGGAGGREEPDGRDDHEDGAPAKPTTALRFLGMGQPLERNFLTHGSDAR